MSMFSRIFGSGRASDDAVQNALENALEEIKRLCEDQDYQISLLNPDLRAAIESRPVYDKNPNGVGDFGFSHTNPIPVNGPLGEIAYLSKIETVRGERVLFHRIGAIKSVDVYEAVTFSGSQWFIFYLDFYHPRRSKLAPEGFRFFKGLGQFSGFNRWCHEFPYDFAEMKTSEQESGLSIAYIPLKNVHQQIQDGVYQRPSRHQSELSSVMERLTTFAG